MICLTFHGFLRWDETGVKGACKTGILHFYLSPPVSGIDFVNSISIRA